MSRNQDLIIESLRKRQGSWLTLEQIAVAVTNDAKEVFSVDQVEFSMTGLRRNHLVLRERSRGPTGVPVFVYSVCSNKL